MKKIYNSVVALMVMLSTVSAQHFVFEPTDTYEDEIGLNIYSAHTVFMQNLTGGILTLSWERLSIDFPAEWDYNLCDFGGCYVGIPESGTMASVSDTTRGYLEITLNANDRSGTGTVVFRVFDYKHPEESDTVSFTVHAGALTDVMHHYEDAAYNVFPNPASGWISIENPAGKKMAVSLLNSQGQVIIQGNALESGSKLDVSALDPGIYFAVISDEAGNLSTEKVFIY